MKIAIRANEYQTKIVAQKFANNSNHIELLFVDSCVDADVYFDFLYDEMPPIFDGVNKQLVFINSLLQAEEKFAENVIVFNGWNSFFENNKLEICANEQIKNEVIATLLLLNYSPMFAPKITGLVSAKSVAMIINEAFFAIEDKVSSPQEIDIAMKLGTNYPFGPFEWCAFIGQQKIYLLLQKLAITDERYMPCKELANNNFHLHFS
jgi:3-hydroxybutyryl-CoA dehydrogenase